MDIAAPAASPSTAPAANPASTPSGPTIASDFDTFLQMLTVQINNQDPLDPMNPEEFAVQLATFSGVEQQVRTNQLLDSLLARQGAQDLSQMAGWVGREALAEMPVHFGGTPVTLDPPVMVGDLHQLVVRDARGAEISRRTISADGSEVTWNGTTTAGNPAPDGLYSFAVETFQDGAVTGAAPVGAYGQVQEVRVGQEGFTLVFAGGVEKPLDDVTGLRVAPL